MKHLKSFEKLNAETYRSAAKKMDKLNQPERANRLMMHSIQLCPYEFSFLLQRPASIGIRGGYRNSEEIGVKKGFITKVSLDFLDFLENSNKDFLDITIWFKFDSYPVPGNTSRTELIRGADWEDTGEILPIFLEEENTFGLSIHLERGMSVSEMEEIVDDGVASLFSIVPYDGYDIKFSDRKSAVEFKKFLSDLLSSKKNVIVGEDRDSNKITLPEMLKECLFADEIQDYNFKIEDYRELIKKLKNIRINSLYQEPKGGPIKIH